MKTRKKLMALLLALAMVLGMAGTASAAGARKGFADVSGHWAEEEINRVLALGLMDGKTDAAFAPNEDMTRAGLVTALYRLAGKPSVAGVKNPFDDVADGDACKDAVLWANSQNIVNGKTASAFVPEGSVTRQEIAKILNGYAAWAVKQDKLASRKDVLSAYPDASEVSAWARDVMNWAVASEFITGSNHKLAPKGTATRAQVAAILCRYMDDASTGDASLDNPRNQDGIKENELLVVSFGTSFNGNRAATIGAVEDAMEKAFPDYSVRRGFTANTIIEHIARRDGEIIDGVEEALDRAKANGVKNLLVQPTHLMNGWEYGDLVKELEGRQGDFETVKIGAPLLATDEDFAKVAQAMVDATASLAQDGKTAVCYMGHGTEAASNGVYARMQKVLTGMGHTNYFVGTVEAAPTAEDLVKLVKEGGYEKVILRPMMIVAGDHANNDMAGDGEDSWKSVFTAAGFEVQCEVKGLGELEAIQDLLAAHAKDAKPLAETGIDVEPNPENSKKPGIPAEPEQKGLADGTYTINVDCKEAMFKIDHCELTVKDGKMTAALTLGSTSFDKMFAGTAAAAALAEEGVITGVTDADGTMATFTLPVAALDEALAYAAHSVRKDTWYDRTLTFDSSTAVEK